jgi:methyltransferase
MGAVVVSILVFAPMLVEAQRAARNERSQRARGGNEPPDDVYAVMRIAYPAAFLAMIAEGASRGTPPTAVWVAGAILFALGKAVKWWAIRVLGRAWTFRVIVVPGEPLITTGPYRWLRHPNYAGVIAELIGAALMTGAVIAGPLAAAGFGLLIRRRIAVEERAIAAAIIRQ